MSTRTWSWRAALALVLAIASTACAHGYRSAEELESAGLGPGTCAQRCGELGMDMGALVLVQHDYAGCVCTPRTSGGASLLDSAGAAASGQAMIAIIEQQRRQQQQQQRR